MELTPGRRTIQLSHD
jgi:hypothetical protein